MKYPKLKELNTYREMIDVFKGYNHNLRIGEGEFYDMTNLSSDNYPILSPRPKRGIYATPNKPLGMVAKDALCYVDGKEFVMNEYRIPLGLSTDDEKPKTLISMGAYVIIMPDKKYINTANLSDFGNIEVAVTTTTNVTYELSKVDGAGYDNVVTQATPPTDPKNMDLWIDTSETPNQLKQYSSTTEMWSAIAVSYIKISATGIGKPFSVDDGITITGVEGIPDLNASTVIYAKGDDFIVVPGMIDQVKTQNTAIEVKRTMPNMDFVVESGNRLWGCRYGTDINGNIVNEIYASKLGDFKNWNVVHTPSISTDSYVASLGTDGQFTGAITHLGYPIFFKENYMHKVYGNYPANFQIQTTACRGVQKGCERSLSIVNEVLYYKARSSICAYDGSLPQEMSSALGEVSYFNAVGGVLGNKYYISMATADEKYHLFVYDTYKGMWHREDDTQAWDFCNCRGDLYYIDYATKQIKTIKGTGVTETDEIAWKAITGLIGTDSPDKKYISRMDVRMSLQVGTRVVISAEYDSSGQWEHLFTMAGTSLRSFAVPIRPKRCDHMRLRIEGYGDAKIYSICKTIEQGSDI